MIRLTNFEAELYGILLAMELADYEVKKMQQNHSNIRPIIIMSDNQGALIKCKNPYYASSGQHIYVNLFNKLQKLSANTAVQSYWCPGNEEIEINCKADELAKKSSYEQHRHSIQLFSRKPIKTPTTY
ncbi:hypothetical protein O181_078057 [Austropuccinia psidii MF-1]|uniref:RNase H type-1 domain-containing protein n=1 Tax=Austropuccinia psidii MF-1 TaxID=1389203 RepID=A0A9Q3FH44_9BASI|nr:hypothetical protein [Austropuccinia psidii MF-1]